MKKINLMPTTIVSLYFSYTIVILGLAISMWLVIFQFSGLKSVLLSLSILIVSLFSAILLRVFGNIGQILFDLKNLIARDLGNLNQDIVNLSSQAQNQSRELVAQIQSLRKNLEEVIEKSDSATRDGLQKQNRELVAQIQSLRKSLEEVIEKSDSSARDGLQNIKSNLEQINCDSKDINQYIHQIQTFFEQIARHLELKK